MRRTCPHAAWGMYVMQLTCCVVCVVVTQCSQESQGVTPVTLKKAPAPGAADGSSGAARATPGTGASGGGYGMLSGREVTAAQVRGSQQAIQFMQRLRDAMRPQPHDEEGESNAESDDDWN